MIKGIVFDLDNTIIDFLRIQALAIEGAADAMIDAGLEMKKNEITKGFQKLYGDYFSDFEGIFSDFLEKHKKKYQSEDYYKILAAGIRAFTMIKDHLLVAYPYVYSTLLILVKRGYKIAVLTDAPRLKAWERIVAINIDEFLDVVATPEDMGTKKPNALAFSYVAKKLGLKPNELLMVGDSLHSDIRGAKKSGLKTCFVIYSNPRKRHDADYAIKRFDDLIKILPPLQIDK